MKNPIAIYDFVNNAEKTKVLLFGPRRNRSSIKSKVKIQIHASLGITLDSDLRFDQHVTKLLQKSYATLRTVYVNRHFLTKQLKIVLCESLVLSLLNYADVVYSSYLTAAPKQKIQKVQNSCLRLSASKEELLQTMCSDMNCDVLCMQETHKDINQRRPKLAGMQVAIERPHRQYGSAIFVSSGLAVLSASLTEENNTEILTIELSTCTVTSIYKPPNQKFNFIPPEDFKKQSTHFIIGDFNSHSSVWGYENDDANGEEVLKWADCGRLTLLHDSKLPPSFNSGRWKRGYSYNPDLLFVSDFVSQQCVKTVSSPVPGTQHRPIACQVFAAVKPQVVPFCRRFNFKKANWKKFSKSLDESISGIEPVPDSYDLFVDAVKRCSRTAIPRGCRTTYIPGMRREMTSKLQEYLRVFDENPFSTDTVKLGMTISKELGEAKQKRWIETLETLDMSKSSRTAWKLLKRLANDPTTPKTKSEAEFEDALTSLPADGEPADPTPMNSQMELLKRLNYHLEKRVKDQEDIINFLKISQNDNKKDIIHPTPPIAQVLNNECSKPTTTDKYSFVLNKISSASVAAEQIPLTGVFPDQIKLSKVTPIYKKGDITSVENYRGISTLSCFSKIIESAVYRRLVSFIEKYNLITPCQRDFRKARSTESYKM
nr:unnamed protein product [Callosobruchus analis]